MSGRLSRLEILVQRGVLTPDLLKRHKAELLTSPNDLTLSLMEADDLRAKVGRSRSRRVYVSDRYR